MAGMYFFAHLLRVSLMFEVYLLLGSVVWFIYTLDHLIDGLRATNGPSSDRHIFHLKNRTVLIAALIVVSILATGLLALVASLHQLILPGLILSLLLGLCLGLLMYFKKRLAFLKELLIALFYILGIGLAPMVYVDKFVPIEAYWIAVLYFLIAYLNLMILSYMDRDIDQKDGFQSVTMWISPKALKRSIYGLAIFGLMLGLSFGLIFRSYFHIYTAILLLILIIHIRAFINPKRTPEQVRRWTELSFWLPILLLVF